MHRVVPTPARGGGVERRDVIPQNLPDLILASAYSEMSTCGVGRRGNSVRNILACFRKGIPYIYKQESRFSSHTNHLPPVSWAKVPLLGKTF